MRHRFAADSLEEKRRHTLCISSFFESEDGVKLCFRWRMSGFLEVPIRLFKKITGITSAAIMSLSVVTANEFISDKSLLTAKAAEFTYPVQEFRIAASDTNRNLNMYSSEKRAYLN